jgi:hypothetical protein
VVDLEMAQGDGKAVIDPHGGWVFSVKPGGAFVSQVVP